MQSYNEWVDQWQNNKFGLELEALLRWSKDDSNPLLRWSKDDSNLLRWAKAEADEYMREFEALG